MPKSSIFSTATQLIFAPAMAVLFAGAAFGGEFTRQGELILTDPNETFYNFDLENSNLKIVQLSNEDWDGSLAKPSTTEGSSVDESQCSGSIVALPGYKISDKALVLSAGHCLKRQGNFLPSKEVMLQEDANALDELHFNFRGTKKLKLEKVIFASYDVVDLSLLQTNVTYAELGKNPPVLDFSNFQENKALRVLGIPQDWKYSSDEYHESVCEMKKLKTVSPRKLNGTDQIYRIEGRVAMNCTIFRGMSGGSVKDSQKSVIGVLTNAAGNDFNLFSPIDPLLTCADEDGGLSKSCLQDLKNKIESP